MTKAKKAVDLYGKNFNCSQAVLTAFAEDFGLSEKMALSLGTSFGGGARNGQLCGAVSGALMVLGLKFGHFESENQEQKSKNYGISVDFTNRVKEKCGSIVCKEMLNADLTTEEGKAKIAAQEQAQREAQEAKRKREQLAVAQRKRNLRKIENQINHCLTF